MKHVLLLSLGPAQALFEAAPSAQDAWCGLWLLDRVAAEAARALARHGRTLTLAGEHVLAPRFEQGRRLAVTLPSGVAPRQAAGEARDAVRLYLGKLGIELVDWLKRALGEATERWFNSEAMVCQLDETFELAWVAVAGDGEAALAAAESALVARLDARLWDTWRNPHGASAGWRGDLVVPPIDRTLYTHAATPETAELWSHLVAACGLSAAAPRCGIGLLQRMLAAGRPAAAGETPDAPQTHSAAHVAFPRFVGAQGEPRSQAILERFAQRFASTVGVRMEALRRFRRHDGSIDAQLLDADRFAQHALEVGGGALDAAALTTLTRHRQATLAALGVAPDTAADVLVLLSWRADPALPRLEGAAGHRFVGEVRRQVLHAGGGSVHFAVDAWVALLPVATAFDCMAAMRAAWHTAHAPAAAPGEPPAADPARPGFCVVAQVFGSALPLAQAMRLAAHLEDTVTATDADVVVVGLDGPRNAPLRWTALWAADPRALLAEAVQLVARAALHPAVARAVVEGLDHDAQAHAPGDEDALGLPLASAARHLPRDPALRSWLATPAGASGGDARDDAARFRERVALMQLAAVVSGAPMASGKAG